MFNFPVTVGSIEHIPEEYRPIYQIKEGETGATLIEALQKKIEADAAASNAIDAERKAKAATEEAARAWRAEAKELFDVDTIEALEDKWSEIQAAHTKAIGDIQDAKSDKEESLQKRLQNAIELRERELAEKLAKAEEEKRTALAEREAIYKSLEDYMRENAVVQALLAAKALGKVLLPHVIARTKMIKDSKGKYLLRVVDERGDERFDADGQPMTVEGLVAEMRQSDDYSFAFDNDQATSRWSTSSNAKPSKTNPWSKKSFNATEQAKILKANPALAKLLEQQAAVEARGI